jgi:transposase
MAANSRRSTTVIGTSHAQRGAALAQTEENVARYLQQLDSADRQEPSLAQAAKTSR